MQKIDITKLLRVCVVFLLFRIDWRKLLVACSILTVVSVLIQISSLPYPLTEWISRPHPALSSFKPPNSDVQLGKSVQLKSVQDAPIVVSLNSSSKVNKSTIISNKATKASRQRRRRSSVISARLPPPSPPHSPPVKRLPRQLEVIRSVIWFVKLFNLFMLYFLFWIGFLNICRGTSHHWHQMKHLHLLKEIFRIPL